MRRISTCVAVVGLVVAACDGGPAAAPSPEVSQTGSEVASGVTLEESVAEGTRLLDATVAELGIEDVEVTDNPALLLCSSPPEDEDSRYAASLGRRVEVPGGYEGDLLGEVQAFWEQQGVIEFEQRDVGPRGRRTTGLSPEAKLLEVSALTNEAQDVVALDVSTACLTTTQEGTLFDLQDLLDATGTTPRGS